MIGFFLPLLKLMFSAKESDSGDSDMGRLCVFIYKGYVYDLVVYLYIMYVDL